MSLYRKISYCHIFNGKFTFSNNNDKITLIGIREREEPQNEMDLTMDGYKFKEENIRKWPIEEGVINECENTQLVRSIVYEPGNGTSYPLIFMPLDNLYLHAVGAGTGEGYTLVSLCWGPKDIRSYAFGNTGFLHWQQVKRVFNLNGIPDAIALAELIALKLGREAMSVREAVERLNTPGQFESIGD